MKRWILTFVVFIAAAPSFGQTARKAELSVVQVIDRLIEAGLKRDVQVIDRLYSPTFFHTNPNGSVMTKEQILAIYKSPPTGRIDSSIHDDDRVEILGKTAIANNRAIIKGTVDGKPFESKYRVTYILQRQHGRWLIVASHASLIL